MQCEHATQRSVLRERPSEWHRRTIRTARAGINSRGEERIWTAYHDQGFVTGCGNPQHDLVEGQKCVVVKKEEKILRCHPQI